MICSRFAPANLRIRLVKKLAAILNGVDLSQRRVEQVFDCAEPEGRMLVLEGWAEPVSAPSSDDDGPLGNERPSPSVWQIIDVHRDGKKNKLP